MFRFGLLRAVLIAAFVRAAISVSSAVGHRGDAFRAAEEDDFPRLEVSLDPPAVPYPEVSGAIGDLDADRERNESANMNRLLQAYLMARDQARPRIVYTIARAMRAWTSTGLSEKTRTTGSLLASNAGHMGLGFLSSGVRQSADGAEMAVRVGVAARQVPDPRITHELRAMETHRSQMETRMFGQAMSSFNSITDDVVTELEAQLRLGLDNSGTPQRGAAAFLASSSLALPLQASVIVVPSSSFPALSSLADAMEARRDVAENFEQAHMLELQVQLISDENRMIAESFEALKRRSIVSGGRIRR